MTARADGLDGPSRLGREERQQLVPFDLGAIGRWLHARGIGAALPSNATMSQPYQRRMSHRIEVRERAVSSMTERRRAFCGGARAHRGGP